jgi:predicted transcriptional regulator
LKKLFPKEKEIMDLLWSAGHSCLISDILKMDPALSRNTVAKVLVHLEKKGYIKVESLRQSTTKMGRAYIPVVSKKEYEEQWALIQALSKDGFIASSLLSYFSTLLCTDYVDDEFLEELETMIQDYKNRKE